MAVAALALKAEEAEGAVKEAIKFFMRGGRYHQVGAPAGLPTVGTGRNPLLQTRATRRSPRRP